ncbi:hypothetical protein F5880DRAFT_1633630 [Lentinula raphanica]|nr:hypothetical protein F5880DRAFT_1633630 [Lentinula raphanica]
MHKDALYGTLDSTTREWNDGFFTHILRRIADDARGKSGKRHCFVFEGDVDPERVEYLNSTLSTIPIASDEEDAGDALARRNNEILPSDVTASAALETQKQVAANISVLAFLSADTVKLL